AGTCSASGARPRWWRRSCGWSTRPRPASSGRASGTSRWPWAAPAASTAASPSRRSSPADCVTYASPPTRNIGIWAWNEPGVSPVRVVAFGGGHGLGASLRALRLLRAEMGLEITAVVTVGDDGGSSGRLRADRGGLPPGDLRQALAALADPFDPAAAR